jgi:4-amino-4-deoxy-L-arabinose transferase-like glycosyltransferase
MLLGLNAGLTVWVVFGLHPMEESIYSDMRGYVNTAHQIANGEYLLLHFFQNIGYPVWVAFWRNLAGGGWGWLKLTHVILVVLSVYTGWRIARRLLPPGWDIFALLLLSTHIQWIQIASFAMSEALYTFLITSLVWFSVRWAQDCRASDAALLGVFFGAGFFVKGSAVFFPPLLLLWSVLRVARHKAPMRLTVNHLAFMAVSALAVALFHGACSKMFYGQFKLGSDNGGLAFIEGKCREKHNFDSIGGEWLSPLHYYLGEREQKHWDVPFSNQGYYWRQGWECIKENPVVVLTSLRYIYYLFTGNPAWPANVQETWYEAWFTIVILPLFIVGLLAASRDWDKPIMSPALALLALCLLSWLTKSELRYRIPFDAIVMIYAALGTRTVWLGLHRGGNDNDYSREDPGYNG